MLKINKSKLLSGILAAALMFGQAAVPGNAFALTAYAAETSSTISAPEDLESEPGYDYIKLSWDKVKGAEGYRVYMYDSSSDTWEQVKSVKGNSCKIDGLSGNTKYRFKVSSLKKVNGMLAEGKLSKSLTVKTEKSASSLPAPGNFSTSSKSDSITISWKSVKGAAGYKVYIYDEDYDEWVKYKNVTGTSCKVTDLSSSTKYKFRVTALEKKNGKYVEGASSGVITASTSRSSQTKTASRSTPGEFESPTFGSSRNEAVKKCNMTVEIEQDGMCIGRVYFGGIESTIALVFNKKGKLSYYSIHTPISYSTYREVVDMTKDTYGYDYVYDDGTYMWNLGNGRAFFLEYDFSEDEIHISELDSNYTD